MQYSVRQSTIEQIFNNFAANQTLSVYKPPRNSKNLSKLWDDPVSRSVVLDVSSIRKSIPETKNPPSLGAFF